MRHLLVLLIRVYQLAVSPLLGPKCRFYPSCSSYALQAVTRFGVLRGGWLSVKRLARCHPWQPGGIDPVPEQTPTDIPGPEDRARHEAPHGLAPNHTCAACIDHAHEQQ